MNEIDIVLPVYNGQRFLKEFLKSLDSQELGGWRLLFRDDDSSDRSRAILNDYPARGYRIQELIRQSSERGVVENVSILLEASNAPYVMLADQDDVWLPHKITRSIKAIKELESEGQLSTVPALVFTDLQVVDCDLRELWPSFLRQQKLTGLTKARSRDLLTQNVAPGCTMILNRALLDLALPIPHRAAMHDWWLIQVAALLGKVGFVPEVTLQYRQHDGNLVGASRPHPWKVLSDLFQGGKVYRERLLKAQEQAGELVHRFQGRADEATLRTAAVFAGLSSHPPVARQWIAWRHGLHKAGLARNIGFYCLM